MLSGLLLMFFLTAVVSSLDFLQWLESLLLLSALYCLEFYSAAGVSNVPDVPALVGFTAVDGVPVVVGFTAVVGVPAVVGFPAVVDFCLLKFLLLLWILVLLSHCSVVVLKNHRTGNFFCYPDYRNIDYWPIHLGK